jgi:phosphatidylserine/phosphatidylglycerophosphate/cardiolipin synthase-like enzyme
VELDFVDPPRSVQFALISGRGHYEEVIQTVLAAKTSVWISTANLKELYVESRPGAGRRRSAYHSVIADFASMAHRGVELRILHARAPSQAFLAELKRQKMPQGLELRACPRVHFKAVIVDGQHLYLGSANWTGAGLGAKGEGRRNFEVGVWTQDEATLDRIQALFDQVWRGAECRGCKIRSLCAQPLDTPKAPPKVRRSLPVLSKRARGR